MAIGLGIAIVLLLVVAASGFFVMNSGAVSGVVGMFSGSASARGSSGGGTASASAPSGGTSSASPADPQSDPNYQALLNAYQQIGSLGNEIGNPATRTGFATVEFSDQIGSSDGSAIFALRDKCDAYLTRISGLKQTIAGLKLSDAYASQRDGLLAACDALRQRVQVLRDTAQFRVRNMADQSWTTVLQPASSNARKAYDTAYTNARPSAR